MSTPVERTIEKTGPKRVSNRYREADEDASLEANPASSETETTPAPSLRTEKLVAGITHDINNLVMVIRASTDALRGLDRRRPDADQHAPDEQGPDEGEARRDLLDRIDRAAAQSAAFTGVITRLDRAQAQPTEATLEQTLAHVAQLLRRALDVEIETGTDAKHDEKAGVAVRVPRGGREVSPYASGTACAISCDLGKLLRALISLCSAASEAGGRIRLQPKHRREIAIELTSANQEKRGVEPREDQVAEARSALASFGASLPLSYADGRGGFSGSIRFASSDGPRASRSRLRADPNTPTGSGHALIAEDHMQVRGALINALTRSGFTVEAVEDGDALVERGLADDAHYDVILVDYDLPGRSGASALEALREAGIETPALMISGNIDFCLHIETMPHTDFLQKPFGLADIRSWAAPHLRTDAPQGAE